MKLLVIVLPLVLSACSLPQRGFVDGNLTAATSSNVPYGETDKTQAAIGIYYGVEVAKDVELYGGFVHRSNHQKIDNRRGASIEGPTIGVNYTFYRRNQRTK